MAFSTLCLSRLFHGFSCKSQHPVLLTRQFWNNRALLGAFAAGSLLLGLVLLVAIPLPGTGAWTGALVADVLDIRMRTALPAIAAGVVIAGCITTAVTCGVAGLM